MTAIARTDVDVSSTQTITGKTVSLASNTVSGTLAQFNTAVSDADLASIAGTETLTNKTITSPKVNQINDTNGAAAVVVSATASAVNQVTVTNAATGGNVQVQATGSDSNVNLALRPKGNTGVVSILAGNSNNMAVFYGPGVAGVVANYWQYNSTLTGGTPSLSVVGSDSNISLNLIAKGTGTVQSNGNPVGVKVSVPASASATGVVGQWAADSSWIYVCTAANTWVRGALATW